MADGIERFEIRWRGNETWKGSFVPSDLYKADFDRLPGLVGPPIVDGLGEFDLAAGVWSPGSAYTPPGYAVRLMFRVKEAVGGAVPLVTTIWYVNESGVLHNVPFSILPALAAGWEAEVALVPGDLGVRSIFLWNVGFIQPGVVELQGPAKLVEDFGGTWSPL